MVYHGMYPLILYNEDTNAPHSTLQKIVAAVGVPVFAPDTNIIIAVSSFVSKLMPQINQLAVKIVHVIIADKIISLLSFKNLPYCIPYR